MSGPAPGLRISVHAMERFVGWMNFHGDGTRGAFGTGRTHEYIEAAMRGWLKRARPGYPVKERRAVAIIDHGVDARYLMADGYVAIICPEGRDEVVVTFHGNTRKWYTTEKPKEAR